MQTTPTFTARGIVREGLVVPLGEGELPEGAQVEIYVIAAPRDQSLEEALTDAERWRRFREDADAAMNWDAAE